MFFLLQVIDQEARELDDSISRLTMAIQRKVEQIDTAEVLINQAKYLLAKVGWSLSVACRCSLVLFEIGKILLM